MNFDPAQLIEALGGIGVLTGLGHWFVQRPLLQAEERERRERDRADKAEAEREWFATRFKRDTIEKCEHMARVTESEQGVPSLRPPAREKLDTLTAIEADVQYRAWALARERSREVSVLEGQRAEALAPPLAGVSPRRIVEVDARKPGARPTDPAPAGYPRRGRP